MSEGIITALITGGLGFAGVIVSNLMSNKKLVNDIKLEFAKYKASTDEKITELTREVREHNNFAQRVPAMEEQIIGIKEQIKIFHK